MSLSERTRSVVIEIDDVINLAGLEEVALAFARSVPGQLVGEAVEAMTETLLDIYLGWRGSPIAAEDQVEAPWSCTGCGSHRGFRRRGFRQRDRRLDAACGEVSFRTAQVECWSCARRFAPVLGRHPPPAGVFWPSRPRELLVYPPLTWTGRQGAGRRRPRRLVGHGMGRVVVDDGR